MHRLLRLSLKSNRETTGTPSRIQVSQDTADELTARGKSHWLTPRQDKVEAKGKGLMQTYYVATDVATTKYSTTSDNSDRGVTLVSGVPGMEDISEEEDTEDLELREQLSGYLAKNKTRCTV